MKKKIFLTKKDIAYALACHHTVACERATWRMHGTHMTCIKEESFPLIALNGLKLISKTPAIFLHDNMLN